MAAFEKNVMNSTQEQDPAKALQAQQEYARIAANLNKQFGAQQQMGAPTIGFGTQAGSEAATAQTSADELNRRKQASTDAFNLGSKIDTRKSQLSDELNAAVRARQNTTDKYASQQSQDTQNANLANQQTAEGARQKMAELDFTQYKSNTDRSMAMADLYAKGDLQSSMAQAASENALKQQDIDNYYSMLEADARADFDAASKGIEWDWQSLQAKQDRNAKNFGTIISASTTLAGAGLTKYLQTPEAT